MVTFNQEDILKALTRLGELASAAHHSVELLVTAGALMVLAYSRGSLEFMYSLFTQRY